MSYPCIVCGSPSEEWFNHPKGAKLDVKLCSQCAQSIALQWLASNLSFEVAYVYVHDKRVSLTGEDKGGTE